MKHYFNETYYTTRNRLLAWQSFNKRFYAKLL